jgi:hypothetical protein
MLSLVLLIFFHGNFREGRSADMELRLIVAESTQGLQHGDKCHAFDP